MEQIKIALISSKILTKLVSDTLSALTHTFKFKFDIYEYEKFQALPELFTEISPKYDGFLTTGMFVNIAMTLLCDYEKPVVAIDFDLKSLYGNMLMLLYSNRNLDFDRVGYDALAAVAADEKPTMARLLEPGWTEIYDNIKVQSYTNDSEEFINWVYSIENSVADRLTTMYNNNELDYVVCRFGSVMPMLVEQGIPCEFSFPTEMYISEKLHELITNIEIHKMRSSMPSAILVSFADDKNKKKDIAKVSLKKHIMDYSKEIGARFIIQEIKNEFQIITDTKTVHNITKNLTICGLKNYIEVQCPYKVCIGYGIATTPSRCLQRARRALKEAQYKQSSFFVDENDNLVGPLGSEKIISIDHNITPEIQKAAEISKLSTLTLKKIHNLLEDMNTDMITTLDLSHNLSMSVRNANRILKKLEDSGLAVIARKESNQTKGRPVIVYKINLQKEAE